MAGSTRRTLLAGLLGTGLALRTHPLRAAALALPEVPMLLACRRERALADGATITVWRSWQVEFARQARGIMVSGTQVSVRVEAPPGLAEFARAEQALSTAGMFPIQLSETGLILSGSSVPAADAKGGTGTADAPEVLPSDLFFPTRTPQRRAETMTLPGGLQGEFELLWQARADPLTGLLAEGERQIVTRVAGTELRSREVWTLGPV